MHLATVVEILQSIKQADMSPMLSRIYGSEGGTELLDVLMKYLYVVRHVPPIYITDFSIFLALYLAKSRWFLERLADC